MLLCYRRYGINITLGEHLLHLSTQAHQNTQESLFRTFGGSLHTMIILEKSSQA